MVQKFIALVAAERFDRVQCLLLFNKPVCLSDYQRWVFQLLCSSQCFCWSGSILWFDDEKCIQTEWLILLNWHQLAVVSSLTLLYIFCYTGYISIHKNSSILFMYAAILFMYAVICMLLYVCCIYVGSYILCTYAIKDVFVDW